jgi:hypothetical protein
MSPGVVPDLFAERVEVQPIHEAHQCFGRAGRLRKRLGDNDGHGNSPIGAMTWGDV